MDKYFDIERRASLKELLNELAKTDSFLQDPRKRRDFYLRLEQIYHIGNEEHFRHYYSDIFGLLVEINSDKSIDGGDINVLGDNLSFLVRGYKAQNQDESGNLIDISDSLSKLYDHVSLDIARIRYSNSGDDRISLKPQFAEMAEKLKETERKLKSMSAETDKLKSDLSKAQTDYIAILGIFASVVLAFVGGLTFSTSVLQNISGISIYRLLLIVSILGAVFIAIIHLMFYYVGKLSGRLSGKDTPHSYFWIAYVVFALIITVVIFGWNQGWVELRNERIEDESYQSDTVEIIDTALAPDTDVHTESEHIITPEE